MECRIALLVGGVDLDEHVRLLHKHVPDVVWSSTCGRTHAAIYVDDPDQLVAAVLDAAARMLRWLPVTVLEVDQDLVGVAEIAHRLGIAAEVVRHWVDGKRGPGGFPQHIGNSGLGNPRRLWRWHDAAVWLNRHYALVDDEEVAVFPPRKTIASIDLLLACMLDANSTTSEGHQ